MWAKVSFRRFLCQLILTCALGCTFLGYLGYFVLDWYYYKLPNTRPPDDPDFPNPLIVAALVVSSPSGGILSAIAIFSPAEKSMILLTGTIRMDTDMDNPEQVVEDLYQARRAGKSKAVDSNA